LFRTGSLLFLRGLWHEILKDIFAWKPAELHKPELTALLLRENVALFPPFPEKLACIRVTRRAGGSGGGG
jgi:hypothetical protein